MAQHPRDKFHSQVVKDALKRLERLRRPPVARAVIDDASATHLSPQERAAILHIIEELKRWS